MKKGRIEITAIIIATGLMIFLSPMAFADSTWAVYNQLNSPLPSDYVSFIDFDVNGNQYIGTSGWGLVVKHNSAWNIWNESNTGVPINAVRLARRDQFANIWLAAASGDIDSSPYGFGVARLGGIDSTWSMQNIGLEVNQTVTGIILNGQTRYVSTYGGGITIYNDIGWIRYRYSSRTEYTYADNQQRVFNVQGGTYIPSDYIRAIDFDPTNATLWIATANGGAVKYDGATWATFKSNNSGLPSNQILSVNINKENGKIAFGTAGFGVAILDGSVWTLYNTANSPMTNGFISTLEYRPRDGELWIGTGYGVWVLQTDGLWRGYIPPDDNFIWGSFYSDISFDSIGSVWVSAYGGGIASLFLDSIPSPPPQDDTLSVNVERMLIYFYNNRPVERIFTDLQIDGVPALADDDTISFKLDSDIGELYSFEVLFGDFIYNGSSPEDDDDEEEEDGDNDDNDDNEESSSYRYRLDDLMISLRFDENDSTIVKISIKDFDAGMNRENFSNTLTVTVGMGKSTGVCVIFLMDGNNRNLPEYDEDDENYQVQVYELAQGISAVDDNRVPLAAKINAGNYPNPFNGNTNIGFDLPSDAAVTVTVYDMLGRTVDKVYSGPLNAGHHSYSWPRNNSVKTGVYIYKISVDGESISKKMVYLK